MPARRLPRSHLTRTLVLQRASLKGKATPLDKHAIPPELWARLDLRDPASQASIYLSTLAAIDLAEQKVSASTATVTPLFDTAAQLISHFSQVLDLAIARKKWPPSTRSFYGRDMSHEKAPTVYSYDDALLWGDKIVDGEAARLAAGGTPMSNPSAAEVQAAVAALRTALGPHSGFKDKLTDAVLAASALLPYREGMEQLILDLYDEVEHHYRHYPAAPRRELCRSWGLIYEGDATPEDPPAPTPPPL